MAGSFDIIDATDLPPINAGIGGLGIGAPSPFAGLPAPSLQQAVQTFQNNSNEFTLPNVLTPITGNQPASTPAANTPGSATNAGAGAGWFTGTILDTGVISDLFIRGTIIGLGFIFVALGLYMFSTGQSVTQTAARAVRAAT